MTDNRFLGTPQSWATTELRREIERIRAAITANHHPHRIDRLCVTCRNDFPCQTVRETAAPSLAVVEERAA